MRVEQAFATFKVHVLEIETRRNKEGKPTSYRARWVVEKDKRKKTWKEPFKGYTQADAFRSQINTAAKNGEAFDVRTGRPFSWAEPEKEVKEAPEEEPGMSWYEFASRYTDSKWKSASGKHRGGISYLLMMATPGALTDVDCPYTELEVRTALRRYGFNTKNRPDAPPDVRAILEWVERHSEPMSRLMEPAVARSVLVASMTNADGSEAAPSTSRRHHSMLVTALNYAKNELKIIDGNPIKDLGWEPPSLKLLAQVDRRSVLNPNQAGRLLGAIAERGPSGPYLMPFFASQYYCALRPEEAVDVTKADRYLPPSDDEWGEFYLRGVAPDVGRDWTDSGETRERRNRLKHRSAGVVRTVPIPPPMVKIQREHEEEHGYGPDGRLYFGVRGGVLSTSTILRVFGWGREDGLTKEEAASPLAERPYDLRHAAISTWLNSGISFVKAAAWAGNSPSVLEWVYAKCLAGQDELDKKRILAVLKDPGWGVYR